jgi:hypothetical protein
LTDRTGSPTALAYGLTSDKQPKSGFSFLNNLLPVGYRQQSLSTLMLFHRPSWFQYFSLSWSFFLAVYLCCKAALGKYPKQHLQHLLKMSISVSQPVN